MHEINVIKQNFCNLSDPIHINNSNRKGSKGFVGYHLYWVAKYFFINFIQPAGYIKSCC